MATSYPGGLDSFTNPTSGDGLDSPSHSAQHANANDAIEAVQAELGTDPAGAYSSVKARLAALDGNVFDAVAYGAVVDGSTDDTAAWQAAIDAAAAAGGGVVTSSLAGVSVIAGALQDTSGANAQLLLPAVDYADGEALPIVIRGPVTPAVVPSVIGATPLPDGGVVLKSTLASGTGALLGGYGPAGTFANFTNVHLVLEDIGVRTATNPTISAVDARRAACVTIQRVIIDTGSYDVDGLTQPSTATSYGLRLPSNNNGAHVVVRDVDVVGFYTGVEFSEHTILDDVNTWGCRVGFNPVAANHSSVALRAMAVHCTTPVKFTGGVHAVDFWQLDVEHANSSQGWRQTTYDVDDASNYGRGFVRWWSVLAGTGAHDSFVKNGGSSVTTSRVGDAIGSGGGGGTTTYVHRDRLTAAASDDTLTLGATPVAGSPLVWVDDVIAWPDVDYSITGGTLTFLSPLVGGEVVQVQYHSTTSTYTAAALSGESVNIADDFTRVDSTSSLGSTSTGAKAWTAHVGTWGISSNRAYVSAGVAAQVCYATVDATTADGVVTIKPVAGGGVYGGICFRLDSTGNCYLLEFQVGGSYAPKVYRVVGGTATVIATGTAVTVAIGDTITVELAGTSIVAKRNGSTIVSTTDSTYQTATRHGMYIVAPGGGSAIRLDDFAFTS